MKIWIGWALAVVSTASAVVCGWAGVRWLQREAARDAAVRVHLERSGRLAGEGDPRGALAGMLAARELSPGDPDLQDAAVRLRVSLAAEQPFDIVDADVPAIQYGIAVVGSESGPGETARGHLALRKGNVVVATAAFESATRQHPDYAAGWAGLGAARRAAGATVQAITAYEAALARSPQDVTTLNNLGALLIEVARAKEAVPLLERALALQDSVATRLNLGVALATEGRAVEALPHARAASTMEPGSLEVWHRLGQIASKAGQAAEAETALQRAVGLSQDPAIAYELGLAQQTNGRFDRAAATLRSVLTAEPDHVDAAYQLGATLQRVGDGPGAEAALQEYVRLAAGQPSETERVAAVQAVLDEARGASGQAAPVDPAPPTGVVP